MGWDLRGKTFLVYGSRRKGFIHSMMATLLLSTVSHACFAQSATPGSATPLDPIVIESPRRPPARASRASTSPVPASTAAPSAAPAQTPEAVVAKRFNALPGGVAVVPQRDFPDTANLTVSKALSSAPGVVVQDFFGGNDQPRIQIRGSGLQQNPVGRGLLMLWNGLPINRADGSYIVGFANPRQAEFIEVYRGYMANQLSATVLGGALNFVSPTGATQPGVNMWFSGGSFGQIGGAGQAGFENGNADGLVQFEMNRRDGFRVYNSSQRDSVAANLGVKLNDNVSTRFFAGFTDLGFDIPGPISKSALYQNPKQVGTGPIITPSGVVNPGPNVLRDRPRREASQFLVQSQTTGTFGPHLIDFALGYSYTDDTFRFPVSVGVRATEGGDFTGRARYAFKPDTTSVLPLFEATALYMAGSADRSYFTNQGGSRGAKFGESEISATTTSIYSGFNIPLWQYFTLSPAISYAYTTRDNDDLYGLPTRPNIAYSPMNPTMRLPNGAVPTRSTSYSFSYDAWTPSLGLSYRPDTVNTFFAALSRSFEPPTNDDLMRPINGTANSSPGRPSPPNPGLVVDAFKVSNLKAQTATTLEAGWRGRTQTLSWDAMVYQSWLKNEILILRDATGTVVETINADKTEHFGVEIGVSAKITDWVSSRIVYTYQDFRFVDNPVRGNNRLAGTPVHLINAMLQVKPTESWTIQGATRWVPAKTPVDNANTLYADPYAVFDLRTEYQVNKEFLVFGEVTNLFNKTYASSTLVIDQARPDQAAFLPGDGRGFYAGIKGTF